MATLKQRLYKKNASGTYDTIHLETSASAVLMSNGTTVEAAVNSKAASNHSHSNYAASTHTHTAAQVGAAAANHTHSGFAVTGHKHAATDITSGVLPVANGGTGATSLAGLASSVGGLNFTKIFEMRHTWDVDDSSARKTAFIDSQPLPNDIMEYDILGVQLTLSNFRVDNANTTVTIIAIANCEGYNTSCPWKFFGYVDKSAVTTFNLSTRYILMPNGFLQCYVLELPNWGAKTNRRYNGCEHYYLKQLHWSTLYNTKDLPVRILANSSLVYTIYGAKLTFPV